MAVVEPKKGLRILTWAQSLTDEVKRLAKLLDVGSSGGLEIIGGTLRVRPTQHRTTCVMTPSGGIPAKSGNTPGSAVCTFFIWNGTTDVLGTKTDTVRNRMPAAFAGSKVTEVYWDQGSWWASVQAC